MQTAGSRTNNTDPAPMQARISYCGIYVHILVFDPARPAGQLESTAVPSRRTILKLMALGATVGPALSRSGAARQPAGGTDAIEPRALRVEWRTVPLGVDARR